MEHLCTCASRYCKQYRHAWAPRFPVLCSVFLVGKIGIQKITHQCNQEVAGWDPEVTRRERADEPMRRRMPPNRRGSEANVEAPTGTTRQHWRVTQWDIERPWLVGRVWVTLLVYRVVIMRPIIGAYHWHGRRNRAQAFEAIQISPVLSVIFVTLMLPKPKLPKPYDETRPAAI